MGEELRSRIDIDGTRCPYCRESVTAADAKVGCDACMAWQHRDCWEAHGSCTSCGHADAPVAPASEISVAERPRARERRDDLPCKYAGCDNRALGEGVGRELFQLPWLGKTLASELCNDHLMAARAKGWSSTAWGLAIGLLVVLLAFVLAAT